MIRAMRKRYFARSAGASFAQPSSYARRAAVTARSTSSASAWATSKRLSSVEGEIDSNHSPGVRLHLLAADEEPVTLADLDDVARLGRRRVLPLERSGNGRGAFLDLGHQSIVK